VNIRRKVVNIREIFVDDVGVVMEKSIREVMECITISLGEDTVRVSVAGKVTQTFEAIACNVACW
jgi:hypothetical protein